MLAFFMFLFLIVVVPLGFIVLYIRVYPHDQLEATKIAAIRGLAISLPMWILARGLGSLMPAIWGSPLLALHEWLDRILPYALLPALGYALFWRYDEAQDSGTLLRRLTTFYAASLAPLGLGEMTRTTQLPLPYILFLLPIELAVIILTMPLLIKTWLGTWTLRRVFLVAGFIPGSIVLSSAQWLLLDGNGILAWLLVGCALCLSIFAAVPRLSAPHKIQKAGI